jgi:hypothetical protein
MPIIRLLFIFFFRKDGQYFARDGGPVFASVFASLHRDKSLRRGRGYFGVGVILVRVVVIRDAGTLI